MNEKLVTYHPDLDARGPSAGHATMHGAETPPVFQAAEVIGRGSLSGLDPQARARLKQIGLTMIELMIVIAIMATLSALATPLFSEYVGRTKLARAIQDIRVVQGEIIAFEIEHNRLPKDLGEANLGAMRDPWGNLYQYQSFETVPKGKWRKDKFLVPINSTYDLWSMGPDGKTATPLTAKASRDDIIRANDGNYIGRASGY